MAMSTSSASGRTATVAAEVWIRPLASVAGTRWTRWTPDSNFSRAKTPLPATLAGDAGFRGSIPGVLAQGQRLNRPITGMVRFGNGYLMVAEDGGIFSFSEQPFFGSLGASPPSRPITSVAIA
jgi:hypothetical protein